MRPDDAPGGGLIGVKGRRGTARQSCAMRQTFELYLYDDEGRRRFEPLLCETVADVVPKVRELIEREALASVEVRLGGADAAALGCSGVHLFTVDR